MIRKLAAVAAAARAPLAGCGGGAKTETLTLKLIAFKPEGLEVKAGTAVTWRNEDGTQHTVTSGRVVQDGGTVPVTPDGAFDSGPLAGGKSFTFTLKKPGTFTYYCQIHPATMRGQIVVTPQVISKKSRSGLPAPPSPSSSSTSRAAATKTRTRAPRAPRARPDGGRGHRVPRQF